jgi:hypothetical protein
MLNNSCPISKDMTSEYMYGSADEYLEQTRRSINNSSQLNNSNTEKRIIEPFLEFLGWSIRVPTDRHSVELDYSINEQEVVDYALLVDDDPEVFVQTYEYNANLPTDMTVEEILNQEFNWGVLTNGEEYEFYRMVNDSLVLVEEFSLDNLHQNIGFLSYMTVDSLKTGRTFDEAAEYDLVVQDQREIERITDTLGSDLKESVETITNADLTSEVSKFENALNRNCSTDDFFDIEEDPQSEGDRDEELRFEEESEDNVDRGEDTTNGEESSSGEEETDEDSSDESSGSIGSRLFSIVTGVF